MPGTTHSSSPSLATLRRRIAAVDADIVAALLRRGSYGRPRQTYPAPAGVAGFTDAELAARARHDYARLALPVLCADVEEDADDADAIAGVDREVIAAVTRRLRLAAMLPALKVRSHPARFRRLRARRDAAAIEAAITDQAVEAAVVERVTARADELRPAGTLHDLPARIAGVFRDWIIPLCRRLQVEVLLAPPPSRPRRGK